MRIALGHEQWSGQQAFDDAMDGDDGSDKFVEAREHHDVVMDPDGEHMEDDDDDEMMHSMTQSVTVSKAFDADGESHFVSPTISALQYGKMHLKPRLPGHFEEIQRLVTFLAFLYDADPGLSKSMLAHRIPATYHVFLNDDAMHANALAPLFQREFAARQGVAREAPLKVAVEVGAGGALNLIIKVRQLMKEKGNEWSQADELPVSATDANGSRSKADVINCTRSRSLCRLTSDSTVYSLARSQRSKVQKKTRR